MKTYINKSRQLLKVTSFILCLLLLLLTGTGYGQNEVQKVPSKKPVKNTFESIWLIDNQTVMVPIKGTFEMDIMHRFGTLKNGYSDFFGFFAPSNIRLGFEYVPVKNLLVGASITKVDMTVEGYAKYALLKQTKGLYPVSITYYGDMAIETRTKNNFRYDPTDRLMYFNQLIIARKISDELSIQIAPSITHVNSVNGYNTGDTTQDGKSIIGKQMHHDHFAIAFSGRYKISPTMAIIANYDQPITKHAVNNPNPNLSAGLEINTSGHTFQVFLGNYYFITPSRNNYFNQNNPTGYHSLGNFLIGFNITRLWNF